MSIESIIGVIAGIFGILTGLSWSYRIIKNRMKFGDSHALFKKLADNGRTDAQKRAILVKLNKNSILRGLLKSEYINNFRWNKKGKEELLFELFMENDITPTDDICLNLLAYRMTNLQERYEKYRLEHKSKID